MRVTIVSGFFLCITLAGCPGFEDSCMNDYARVNYGTVRETPDGFEVGGKPGPLYAPMEVIQAGAALRPGMAGDPADDYPKPRMRDFYCRMPAQ